VSLTGPVPGAFHTTEPIPSVLDPDECHLMSYIGVENLRREGTIFRFRRWPTHSADVDLLDLDQHALDRHGLVVKSTSGIAHRTWYRMIERGDLQLLHPGIARMAGTPRNYVQRIAAAVWSCGGNALASHRSAAHLHDLGTHDDEQRPVDVILPGRSRKLSLDGVVIHRPTDALRLAPQIGSGIRCTNVLRTLVDLGAVAPGDVHAALGRALSMRTVDLRAVDSALAGHGRRGRAGVGPLRRAFAAWSIDAKPADSVLEVAFARLVRAHGLPPFEFHPVIEGWEVDFRLVGTQVIVECDGWTTHGLDPTQFERDRRRDDDLAAAGWIVKRFTYRAITRSGADTARRIQRALATPIPEVRSRPA